MNSSSLILTLIAFYLLQACTVLPELERQEAPQTSVPTGLPATAKTFSTAKRWLYDRVYHDHRQSFYCGCPYTENRQVLLANCGMAALESISRAQRIEAEHVFPASQFGNFRQCWREPKAVCGRDFNGSGRQCCEKNDPVFQAAHNDLHNLFPAVGHVNGKRSNYNWGMVEGEQRQYGQCDIEIDSSIRRAEPPQHLRGDIARTMFYMSETYGFRLSRQDQQLYQAWNRQDPVDRWELERNSRIKAIQGIGNRFIEQAAGT